MNKDQKDLVVGEMYTVITMVMNYHINLEEEYKEYTAMFVGFTDVSILFLNKGAITRFPKYHGNRRYEHLALKE